MNFENSDEKFLVTYTDANQKLVGVMIAGIGVLAVIPTLLIKEALVPMLLGALLCLLVGLGLVITTPTITTVADLYKRIVSIDHSNRTKYFNSSKQLSLSDVKYIEMASFLYSNLRRGKVLYLITHTGDKIKLAGWQNYKSPFDQTEITEEYFVSCGQGLATFLNVPFNNESSKWHSLDS